MRPQLVTVSSASDSATLPVDHRRNPFSMAIGVLVTAGSNLTYEVDYTMNDIFDPTVTPIWLSHSSLVSKTTSATGNLAFPVRAIKLSVSPWVSGSATMILLQS